MLKTIIDSIKHSIKFILIGLVIGALISIPVLKLAHKVTPKTDNIMIFAGELNDQSAFRMIVKMISLPFGSDLIVYVNSPGGSIAALENLFLIAKLNNIHIHAKSVGPAWVASAAAIFFVKADTMEIDPATIFVFHLGEVCVNGDPNGNCHKLSLTAKDPIERHIANSTAAMNKTALDKCVITPEEYKHVLAGEDVYVSGQEAINNMKKCH